MVGNWVKMQGRVGGFDSHGARLCEVFTLCTDMRGCAEVYITFWRLAWFDGLPLLVVTINMWARSAGHFGSFLFKWVRGEIIV